MKFFLPSHHPKVEERAGLQKLSRACRKPDATLDHHDGDHDELPHSLTGLDMHMQMPAHPKAPQQSLSMGALIKTAQLAIIQDRKQDALHYLGLLRDALSNCYLDAPKLE